MCTMLCDVPITAMIVILDIAKNIADQKFNPHMQARLTLYVGGDKHADGSCTAEIPPHVKLVRRQARESS